VHTNGVPGLERRQVRPQLLLLEARSRLIKEARGPRMRAPGAFGTEWQEEAHQPEEHVEREPVGGQYARKTR
jgi:hypothetical protein